MFCHCTQCMPGEPVRGELHVLTDAVTPVPAQITVYNDGSLVARTIAADEFLIVDEVFIKGSGGGELHVYMADATGVFVAGGTIVRAMTSLARSTKFEYVIPNGRAVAKGLLPWFGTALLSEIIDVVIRGRIVKG